MEHPESSGVSATLQPAPANKFSETEPLFGDRYWSSLLSTWTHDTTQTFGRRPVVDSLRRVVLDVPGAENITFLRRRPGARPTSKPVSVKVRGDDPTAIRAAADHVVKLLSGVDAVNDISVDDTRGGMELRLRLNGDAIVRSGVSPTSVIRALRLFSDGEVAADTHFLGDKIEVRVRSSQRELQAIDKLLKNTISMNDGREIALAQLVHARTVPTVENIKHYNLRRAITVEADLDKAIMDTPAVNRYLKNVWRDHAGDFPDIDLDFSGELDEIQESVESLVVLFAIGVGIIYLILGTQFKSYVQPLFVLVSVPLAFTGVIFGLLIVTIRSACTPCMASWRLLESLLTMRSCSFPPRMPAWRAAGRQRRQ